MPAHATWLLLAAIAAAILARRLALPYTTGLVVGGGLLVWAGIWHGPLLTHTLIYETALPPLLFEAALCLSWQALRAELALVFALAIGGVVLAALAASALCHAGLGWSWQQSALFAVLIAATDPVAVIALFKDLGLGGRLSLLVESESLFNDGVAACLYALVLQWVAGADPHAGDASLALIGAKTAAAAVASVALGAAAGWGCMRLAGSAPSHLVATAITLVAAYGSFQAAEAAGLQGVAACVASGLVMGNAGPLGTGQAADSGTRLAVMELWEFIAFLANSVVFLGIGLELGQLPAAGLSVASLALLIGIALLGRAASVYPVAALFARAQVRLSLRECHVLWWGGLRGALGLALALSLPPTLPQRGTLLLGTYAVVVFSVIAQGLTMPWLLARLGLRAPGRVGISV